MYELKTEREQLMQKVDAQSYYIEKADATAKAQAKQLLDQKFCLCSSSSLYGWYVDS
jgi:hypothetical protein